MTTRKAQAARSIVVGTDFSRSARNAVARAIQIAEANGATLHVVHASPPLPRALARVFGEADDRTLRARLREVLDDARSAGVRARSHCLSAGATRGLSDGIRELNPALVIVGARGQSTRDAFVGSTAERVAFFGRRPVLLVRRASPRPYRRVVIATDVDSALANGLSAADFAAGTARRSIVHAYVGPFEHRLMLDGVGRAEMRIYRAGVRREALAKMRKLLRNAGADEELLQLKHGRAPRVLQHVDASALLVINRRRSLARHFVLGSTTRAVIAHGRSDVLIV